jgi:hypothetical protein
VPGSNVGTTVNFASPSSAPGFTGTLGATNISAGPAYINVPGITAP